MSINKNTIKKLTLIVVAAGAVVGVAVLSSNHYNRQARANEAQAQAVAVQEADNAKAKQAELEQARSNYELIRVECEKGVNAWNQLPSYLRKTVQAPICGQAAQR